MMIDSMGALLTKLLLRKKAKAVLMSIKMAGGGGGGGGGGGIWKVSTHEDPAVVLEKQRVLQQERERQEAEREAERVAEREAEREANLPAYVRARRAGRGQMLIPRTPDPWTRPKPEGYGFTVGTGPKR